MKIKIKSPKEIELMRKSGHLAAYILDEAVRFTEEGVTTNQINDLVHQLTIDNDAYPAPLNYHGFPKSVCTSVNDVVTHGIPSDYILKNGDIVNIDITCILNGYHGDTSRMVQIGTVAEEIQNLIKHTYEAMLAGINSVSIGGYISDIGSVIQDIADEHNYGVVEEYCGHGIGRGFHEDPNVLHYRQSKNIVPIVEGMVFTIEPMLNLGARYVKTLKDNWTVVTEDSKPSAQFEHTIAVTKEGIEILTAYPKL